VAVRYLLRLYIGGNGPRSTRALRLVKRICEEKLMGAYDLEVVDIHQQLARASSEGIRAVPTFVKERPAPAHRIVGELTREMVLAGLSLP
jgi:circadian clock protein KaiB